VAVVVVVAQLAQVAAAVLGDIEQAQALPLTPTQPIL